MNGKDFIFLLNEQEYIPTDASRVSVVASIDGYISINAEYNVMHGPPAIDGSELDRLKTIEAKTAKLIETLNKGEVDYDLVTNLEKIING